MYGFAIAIVTDGRLQFGPVERAGATGIPTVYYGTTVIKPGKLYRSRS